MTVLSCAGRGTAIYLANVTRCLQSRKLRRYVAQWPLTPYTWQTDRQTGTQIEGQTDRQIDE
jgi:hypothetical protein